MKGAIVSEWVVRCWRSTCSRNRQASGKKAAAIEAWQAEGWQLVDRPGHGRAWWCGQCQANASVDPPAAIAEDRERARARLDELGEQPEVVIGVDWAAPGSEDRGVSIVVTQAAEPSDGPGLPAIGRDRRYLVGDPGPELKQLGDLVPVEEIPRPGGFEPVKLHREDLDGGLRWLAFDRRGRQVASAAISHLSAPSDPAEYAELLAERMGLDVDVLRRLGGL